MEQARRAYRLSLKWRDLDFRLTTDAAVLEKVAWTTVLALQMCAPRTNGEAVCTGLADSPRTRFCSRIRLATMPGNWKAKPPYFLPGNLMNGPELRSMASGALALLRRMLPAELSLRLLPLARKQFRLTGPDAPELVVDTNALVLSYVVCPLGLAA